MINENRAKQILRTDYSIENYCDIIKFLLRDKYNPRRVPYRVEYNGRLFSTIKEIGASEDLDLTVYEVVLNEGVQNRRVAITQDMFKVLKGQMVNNAIVAFVNEDKHNYRISLLTSNFEADGDRFTRVLSNPRRYSYSLGLGTKTKTAESLILGGGVNSLEELLSRFSIEAVNKQFYDEIALAFTKLTGGNRNGTTYFRDLEIDEDVNPQTYSEFSVRLIGRLVFCWFLKEKKSESGKALIPEEMFSDEKIDSCTCNSYYNKVIEPLFFELLNTDQDKRKSEYKTDEYKQIPYLNGGLFRSHDGDYYSATGFETSGRHSLVTIPNEWFRDLFDVMRQYNFTVDENTSYDVEMSIDPEMLGRIFENLLAEINPETGENAKKSTGSFYTPRDIVDFMVDSSITRYLEKATKISSERIEKLIDYCAVDSDLKFTEDEKKSLIDALYSVTILDPACGSGAFPIGMLQKIVYILQVIDPTAELWFDKAMENPGHLIESEFEKKFHEGSLDYIRKLCIIQNSIFGIDIQPIAVEIARLRCFLSLIIEEKVYDDVTNRGINPLPNLEFKFVISNSLIKLDNMDSLTQNIDSEGNRQVNMLENSADLDEIARIREKYFNANNNIDKQNLINQFKNLQGRMQTEIVERYGSIATERYDQLSVWKPFTNNSTAWFDSSLMFGIVNGFDIVIGNPPYIKLSNQMNDGSGTNFYTFYDNKGYKTCDGNGDIYCLFYEAGYNFLKDEGILAYITSNTWMRSGFGKKLRNFLAENTNPLFLIDFGKKRIFESATVSVNILIFEKSDNKGKTKGCIAEDVNLKSLSAYVRNGADLELKVGNSWVIWDSLGQNIKNKVGSIGRPLKEWGLKMNRGIITGLNSAFIIDAGVKDTIMEDARTRGDNNSKDILQPILRGKDIKKYRYTYDDKWLIATFPSKRYNIDDYPAVRDYLLSKGMEHLEQAGKKFITNGRPDKSRKKTNNKWFETQDNISYWEEFGKEKILYRQVGFEMDACLEDGKYLANDKCYMITGPHLSYILCFLNSNLFNKIILKQANITGGKGEDFLGNISLPEPNDFAKWDDICQKICADPVNKDLDRQINSMIYDEFNLTDEQREYIDSLS